MMDFDVIKEIPGYKEILKAVLKFQIQQLVEQLACHTEEESIILTANVADGTLSHFGSVSGIPFLEDHEDMKSKFLAFCLNAHQRKKQREMLEREILKVMPSVPSPPSRYAAPRVTYSPQSPSYMSPHLHDRNPVAMTRVSAIDKIHTHRVRHEPYPAPRAIKKTMASFDEVYRTDSDYYNVNEPIIKIERDEESSSQKESNVNAVNNENSSRPSSPLQMPASSSQVKNESIDMDDDVVSVSSTSTIPYETLSDDVNLDLDLSDKILGVHTLNSAPQVPCDTNLNEKQELLSLSEMDLEITDVRSTKLIDSQNNWSPSISVGMNFGPLGAKGKKPDLQTTRQGCSDHVQSLVNINWPKDMQILNEIPSISTSNRSRRIPISVSTTLSPEDIKKINRECGVRKQPPFSYVCLIQMALNTREDRKMVLNDICKWIEDTFLYYKYTAKAGWKKTLHSKLSRSNMFERERNKPFHECCWTMKSDVVSKLNHNPQHNHMIIQSSSSEAHLSLPTVPTLVPMLPLHSTLSTVSTSNSNKKVGNSVVCQKLFTSHAHLELHMGIHTGEKPYVCQVCGKCYIQKGNMKKHTLVHFNVNL